MPSLYNSSRIPFVPTPLDIAGKMLQVADPDTDEIVVDVGSGDGRIPRLAAKDYGCTAVGIDNDPLLANYSLAKLREDKVKNAHIVLDDLFGFDFSKVDTVTMYLVPDAIRLLAPLLNRQLRANAKVVSHNYQVPGFKLEMYEEILSREDGKRHIVALYRNTLDTKGQGKFGSVLEHVP